MGLDVHLLNEPTTVDCACTCGHLHTRTDSEELYSANITHKLSSMAQAAGIYKPLWCPDEMGINKARDLAPLLREGLTQLQSDPRKFQKYNSPNGWGMYPHLVSFVKEYLAACEQYPDATVYVSR